MPPYEKSVFINCPYDGDFEPLFHAIVLTIAAKGFTPRCARETEGQAEPRISRILQGLRECKYSIHDLSRYQGQGEENLARFNMPLELGIALGYRFLGEAAERAGGNRHNWIALVPSNFVHQKVISDLAGIDASDHDQTPQKVIQRVAKWLTIQPDYNPPAPAAKTIFDAYAGYCSRLDVLKAAAMGDLSWPETLREAQGVASALPEN